MARLDAGTYHLVLSGCGNGSAQRPLPAPPGGQRRRVPHRGPTASWLGHHLGHRPRDLHPAAATGPEDTYYWYTCQGAAARHLHGVHLRPRDLGHRARTSTPPAARRVSLCNDDACGTQSSLSAAIPAGPGLHAFYVDGYNGASGVYTFSYTRP
jgi:hypothetical protein